MNITELMTKYFIILHDTMFLQVKHNSVLEIMISM